MQETSTLPAIWPPIPSSGTSGRDHRLHRGACRTCRSAPRTALPEGRSGRRAFRRGRGQVRISTGTDAGKRLTLDILGSGDVFGEIGAARRAAAHRRSARARADRAVHAPPARLPALSRARARRSPSRSSSSVRAGALDERSRREIRAAAGRGPARPARGRCWRRITAPISRSRRRSSRSVRRGGARERQSPAPGMEARWPRDARRAAGYASSTRSACRRCARRTRPETGVPTCRLEEVQPCSRPSPASHRCSVLRRAFARGAAGHGSSGRRLQRRRADRPPRDVLRCRRRADDRGRRGHALPPRRRQPRRDSEAAEVSARALLIEPAAGRRGSFQVLTPHAIASVRGTIYAVDVQGGRTSVFVAAAASRSAHRERLPVVVLGAGQGVDVVPGQPLDVKLWGAERAAGYARPASAADDRRGCAPGGPPSRSQSVAAAGTWGCSRPLDLTDAARSSTASRRAPGLAAPDRRAAAGARRRRHRRHRRRDGAARRRLPLPRALLAGIAARLARTARRRSRSTCCSSSAGPARRTRSSPRRSALRLR